MKSTNYYYVSLLFVCVLFLYVGCKEDDPCDATVQPEKAVNLKATVHVLTIFDEPVSGIDINLTYFKVPCGAEQKGEFKFYGKTNDSGIYYGSMVGYNIRNLDDEIVVIGVAPNIDNYHEQNFAQVVFKYKELSSLSTKEVHLYIYTK